MCLGIPGKVIQTFREHDVLMGKVDFSGVVKQVCLEHVPLVEIGQYVLVHVGFALSRIDEGEAARVFQFLKEMDQLDELSIASGGDGKGTGVEVKGTHLKGVNGSGEAVLNEAILQGAGVKRLGAEVSGAMRPPAADRAI